MLRPKSDILLFTTVFILIASEVNADVVWPALYVTGSHFGFWYVVILGLLLEVVVLRLYLIPDIKKSLLVSLIANLFSATVGICVLTIGMIGWHLVVDTFVRGTFNILNQVATFIIMLLGSAILETLIVRGLWKYQLRQTFPILILGNLLSYGVIAIDLFFLGGWNKQF
jgi:hypothetical protein